MGMPRGEDHQQPQDIRRTQRRHLQTSHGVNEPQGIQNELVRRSFFFVAISGKPREKTCQAGSTMYVEREV